MPTLNPWVYFAALLVVLALCAGSAYEGHSIGVDSQKVADQVEFDRINAAITAQKAHANAELLAANTETRAQKERSDTLTHKLENEHADNQNLTERNRVALDAIRLRFSADPARCGSGGADSKTDCGTATGDASTTVCQLSDQADKSLKAIVHDADTLRDDYKLLYDWSRGVTCY